MSTTMYASPRKKWFLSLFLMNAFCQPWLAKMTNGRLHHYCTRTKGSALRDVQPVGLKQCFKTQKQTPGQASGLWLPLPPPSHSCLHKRSKEKCCLAIHEKKKKTILQVFTSDYFDICDEKQHTPNCLKMVSAGGLSSECSVPPWFYHCQVGT